MALAEQGDLRMAHMSYEPTDPAASYEPHRYASKPVHVAGTEPRHRAREAVSTPASKRAAHPRRLGESARMGRRWPPVGNDLFFVAHDDWGRLRLHRDVARLGLSAAVLAELLLTEYATIHDGALVPLVADDPVDPVAARVLRRLYAEPHQMPVRDWLAFLADEAQPDGDVYGQVARRLQSAGLVQPERVGLLRRSVRYVPVDVNTAAWPWARISGQVERGDRLGTVDTALGGLILATDLHRHVLTGDPGSVECRLRRNTAAGSAAVRELLRHTETAVGSTVFTGA